MPSLSKQVTADGMMVDDYDPPHPTFPQARDILLGAFESRQWSVNLTSPDETKRLVKMDVVKGDHRYTLNVFVFLNFANSARGRTEEKRIQLRRPYSEHAREFSLPNTGEERCLLLGIYMREEKVVIAAWDALAYKEHSVGNSCYVKVPAMADAMRNGFGQSIDGKGRLVCCFLPDLLPYYVENMRDLHDRVMVNEITASPQDLEQGQEKTLNFAPNEIPASLPHNRIIYGAPGTGKSHLLNSEVERYFGSEALHERVTFHPEFTYGQFVGAYRPRPLYKATEVQLYAADRVSDAGTHEPLIDYVFVPGPLIRLFVQAWKNPTSNFVLVIEEINRANAPAVFGEIFQLLDRDEFGVGKFSVVVATEVQDYLRSMGLLIETLRLPKNLYLWATMNSADQGVMPLDAAFKRRWSFEYVALNSSENATSDWMIFLKFLGKSISWNSFRYSINAHLTVQGIPDDRLLGPFFMRRDELENENALKNKLLLYLRDDVVRHNPEVLFRGSSLSYGAIVEAYDHGKNIFAEGINFEPTQSF